MFQDYKIAYMREHVKIKEVRPLSFLRQSVAYMLAQSARKIPHAAMITHFDVTPLVDYCKTTEKSITQQEGETPEHFRHRRAVRKNYSAFFLKTLAHAKGRTQFNQPIIDFQAIGHKVARMWSRLQAAKWSTYYAAWLSDLQSKKMANAVPLTTSMVKHFVPETAKEILDDAITVFGGYGYFLEQDVERRYRDNRIIEIYEGTVQVQLNNMMRLLTKLNPDYLETTLL